MSRFRKPIARKLKSPNFRCRLLFSQLRDIDYWDRKDISSNLIFRRNFEEELLEDIISLSEEGPADDFLLDE